MEVEFEATIEGTVVCPECGCEFDTELTGTVSADVEPEYINEGYD